MTYQLHAVEHLSLPRWRALAVVWLTALLAFRLAALALNRTELMFDEAQYWTWAQDLAFGYYSKPPLLAWVIAAATGMCGDAEFCVRLAAPLLHWLAGVFLYFAGEALYGGRTGFWAAIVFATAPGASFSAGIISTDVPLIACWAAALLAWVKLMQTRSWAWALALGAAIGLGLNAKYAMAYFFLCAGLYLARVPEARWLAKDLRLASVLGLALLFLLPNLLWNLEHGFITFSHTAANAKWEGPLLHPLQALKFFAEQFGVFGPILFAALLWAAWRCVRPGASEPDRMLLFFSLPVLALVLFQALLSRAHANWAAVAYPAAAILVTDMLLRLERRCLFAASLALHLVVMMVITAANWAAPRLAFPARLNPYERMLGWRSLADAVRARLAGGGYAAILTEDRWVTAELLYYLRDSGVPIRAWAPDPRPRDHYELTRPFRGGLKDPVLLVTLRPSVDYVTASFAKVTVLGSERAPAGPTGARTVRFLALDGYKGEE